MPYAITQVANAEQVILGYFETNYIGELRRGIRFPPTFPHAMWNMILKVGITDLPLYFNSVMLISGNLLNGYKTIRR